MGYVTSDIGVIGAVSRAVGVEYVGGLSIQVLLVLIVIFIIGTIRGPYLKYDSQIIMCNNQSKTLLK